MTNNKPGMALFQKQDKDCFAKTMNVIVLDFLQNRFPELKVRLELFSYARLLNFDVGP